MTEKEVAVEAMKDIVSGLAAGGYSIDPDEVARKAESVAYSMKKKGLCY